MSDTRMLDHGTPPERFARGWHCLGLADSFRDGTPHGIEAFGGKVVWEDSKGELRQRARRLLPAHGRRPDPGLGARPAHASLFLVARHSGPAPRPGRLLCRAASA